MLRELEEEEAKEQQRDTGYEVYPQHYNRPFKGRNTKSRSRFDSRQQEMEMELDPIEEDAERQFFQPNYS